MEKYIKEYILNLYTIPVHYIYWENNFQPDCLSGQNVSANVWCLRRVEPCVFTAECQAAPMSECQHVRVSVSFELAIFIQNEKLNDSLETLLRKSLFLPKISHICSLL